MGCLVLIFALPFIAALRGYAMHVLWGWFITPAFDVPAPRIILCLGIALVLGLFTDSRSRVGGKDKDSDEECIEMVAYGFAVPLFALGVGSIYRMFA